MPIALWIASKFLVYCAMALLATRLFSFGGSDRYGFMFRYAALRLAVGFAAGLFIVHVWTELPTSWGVVPNYILSFGVFRYLEWLVVLLVMTRKAGTTVLELRWKGQAWLLLGVALNVGIDLAAAAYAFSHKFYC